MNALRRPTPSLTAPTPAPRRRRTTRMLAAATGAALALSAPGAAFAQEQLTVQSGDTLSELAQDHGLGSSEWGDIVAANPALASDRQLQPGQVLVIPSADGPYRARPSRYDAPKAPDEPQDTVWDRLAECESGGNWSINTGNGYYGGIQFSLSSWRAVGGSGYPHHHSRETQIEMGERLKAQQGWGAWPACSRKLGLR